MAAWVQLVVLLGLVLACDGSTSLAARPCPRLEDSDFYAPVQRWLPEVTPVRLPAVDSNFSVLVQQWLPEVCSRTSSTSRACVSPRLSWRSHLVLHTLQLHGPDHSVYEECTNASLDLQDLPSATRSALSAQGPEVTDGVSWAEAWRRYGTCAAAAPRDYFEEALRLHQATKTPDLLRFAVERAVSAGDLLAAYGGARSAVLECHEGSNLSAVYTCWSGSGTGSQLRRVDCPPELGESRSCGPEVGIPGFVHQSTGQSQFATAIWLVQYVFLLSWFVWSWRADARVQKASLRRRRGCRICCACTRRTPIQLLAITHAGTGVFSELWAILWDTAGETGLPMWPVMSVLELASNLAISVLMLFWYTVVCASLGRSTRRRAYCGALLTTGVVLLWSLLYLKVNIQRSSTRDMKQREMDPIPWVSFCYYIINMILDVFCLAAVHILQGALFHKEELRPTLRNVFYINLVSVLDSVAMVLVHVEQVQEFLSMYVSEKWHPWTMGVLFFIRYVTVSLLIEPVSECETGGQESEISSALHFGPLLSYEFERGSALVICNGGYAADSRHEPLDNRLDAHRWAVALECIGFKVVEVCFDLSADGMMRRFEEWVASARAEEADGLAFAYSGHGNLDSLIGVDGAEVRIPEVMSKCRDGEALLPKLFFFDCCRGTSVEPRRLSRNRLIFEVLLGCSSRGPSAMADCLACYATARHFRAFGDEGEFTKSLCQRIEELAEDGGHDIEDALKLAGAEVAIKKLGLCYRQCPTYESTLTRRFVLRRAHGAGRSSSTLTGTTAQGSDLFSCADTAATSSTTLLSAPVV